MKDGILNDIETKVLHAVRGAGRPVIAEDVARVVFPEDAKALLREEGRVTKGGRKARMVLKDLVKAGQVVRVDRRHFRARGQHFRDAEGGGWVPVEQQRATG